MADSIESMWPAIPAPVEKPPVAMMREQASLLADLTLGLIEAEVRTEAEGAEFYHDFVLVVPALGDYRHTLFRAFHGLLALYPAHVILPGDRGSVACEGPAHFANALREALNSPEAMRVVSTIMAQVAA